MLLDPFENVAIEMQKKFKGVIMDHIGFDSLIVRCHTHLKRTAEKFEDKYGKTSTEIAHS